MSPVRRALVAITSAQPPLYPEGKETDRAVWKDHSSEFHSMLDNLLKLGDINPEKVNDHQPGQAKADSNV
ncbi:hypothetical protein AtubIFM61612_009445 [Aspergillus tubingensis]|nr:hypothetical protein AtubIFM61612_009445 [Aspergillus tubingensis]